MLDQVDGIMCHLLRQLARGAQHQRARLGRLEMATVGRVLATRLLGRLLAVGDGLVNLALPLGLLGGDGVLLLLQQRVQHGQQEGGSLAGTGLAGHHQVHIVVALGILLGQRHRDGSVLHHGRLGVAQVQAGLHQRLGQAQLHKAVVAFGHGSQCVSCQRGMQMRVRNGVVGLGNGLQGSIGHGNIGLRQCGSPSGLVFCHFLLARTQMPVGGCVCQG